MAKSPSTEVTPTTPTGLPAYLQDQSLVGAGVSHDADDSIVPLLRVLQALSPQVSSRKPEYVPGAEEGKIWLRGTNLLWDEIWFIQCGFDHVWNEWVPRDDGGGFRGRHETKPADAIQVLKDPNDPEKGKTWMSPDHTTEYVETRNHFGLILPTEPSPEGQSSGSPRSGSLNTELVSPEPAVLTLSSTGHTFSKNLTTTIRRNKAPDGAIYPAFSKKYLIKTAHQTKGNYSWFQYVLGGQAEWVDEAIFEQAREFHKMIEAGQRHADVDQGELDADKIPF